MSLLVEMMLEKFQFLFLEAVCLIRSFIVQIVFPKNDLSEVSWWGIYGLRGRKTINCFCQMRTRAFPFLHLICPVIKQETHVVLKPTVETFAGFTLQMAGVLISG